MAFGLAALLALQRRRYSVGDRLAVLCPLGSPVAGLFLAMAGVAFALAQRREHSKRPEGLAIAGRGIHPAGVPGLAFPEGGWAPVPVLRLYADPAVRHRLPDRAAAQERALRWGAALYGAGRHAGAGARDPDGRQRGAPRRALRRAGAALRALGTALDAAARGCSRCWVLAFAALGFWQWSPAVRDVIKYMEDPAAKSDYFEPLRQFLATLPDQRRIEIPFTRSHWEGAEVAARDAAGARLAAPARHRAATRSSTAGPLNRLTYASWLSENAVRYVALPSAKPDKSSYGERALIERGLPYLRLRWRSEDWRVYEVLLPAPFVIPQKDANIVLEQLDSDELLLDVKRPGEAIVSVRWTPYWFATGACVEPDGNWTRVIAGRKGFVRLSTRFSPERLFSRGRRCEAADGGLPAC